ncbi:MAG: adenylate/guanylate cyclase domain-containing protein [Acidobacteriota bacterium]
MFWLTYTVDGETRRLLLAKERVSLGRMPDSDLVVPDHTVSRRHADLVRTAEGWKIVDLGSRNGTRVNDVAVHESPLSSGDTIHLGSFPLRFEEDIRDRVQITPSEEDGLVTEGTIIRPVEEIQSALGLAELEKPAAAPALQDVQRLSRVSRILSVLSEVSRTLLSADDVEGVLEKILDVVFEYLPAQQAVILLVDPKTGALESRAVRQTGKGTGPIRISSSIARKSREDGVAILCHDAQVDPRFKAGESIRFLGIRSALCVPLKLKDKVLGIIYADTPLKTKAFGDFDLDLLSALSGYAAMGIRQAELRAAVEAERRAKARLERYHSPSVVRRIISAGEAAEGIALDVREVTGTVLFADLVGFTSMTENMPPGEVAHMLNACFSRMTDVIFGHEGTLDKFIGDCVMAVFGAPIPTQDHAVRAVQCALDMRWALEKLNREQADKPPLVFRFGINSGPLVAGDIGSVRRMEFTVLGATVNAASRIETSIARPGQILVGEATYHLAKDEFLFEKVGDMEVKGLSKPLAVYEVKGQIEDDPGGRS